MSALEDRRAWLDHLHECVRCPTSPCDAGLELAAAVRDSLLPGEFWEGVYRPRRTALGPAAKRKEDQWPPPSGT